MAAAEERDKESCDNGRDKALLGRNSGCDTKGDRQRQCNNSNDETSQKILCELVKRVFFFKDRQESRLETC